MVSRLSEARGRWRDAAALVVATVAIGLPALATRNGFASDYTNHVWLVWVQSRAISAHVLPTYFLHAPAAGGVFNPFFEFYGGTLYATSGASLVSFAGRLARAARMLARLPVAGRQCTS